MARQTPPFAHKLPWWEIRTIETTYGSFDFMLMVDGSLAVGFAVAGVDLYSFSDDRLNEVAASSNRALNLLPEDGYLQADWRVGLDYEDVVSDYAKRGTKANPLLKEQRARRVEMLRTDALMRGRLVYYVGQRHAFGKFSPMNHRAKPTTGLLGKLAGAFGIGAGSNDPYATTAEQLLEAATGLAQVASSIVSQFRAVGIGMTPMNEEQLLGEMHQALNPSSSAAFAAPKVVRRREDLHPDELAKTPYVFMKPFTIREQMPLGDFKWTDSTFTVDDPPVLHRALTLQHFEGASSCVDSLFGPQFATSLPYRLVTTYRATDRGKMTAAFIAKQKRMNAVAVDGHVRNIQAEIAMGEYEDLIELVNSTDQRLFQGSMTVLLSADDEATLDKASEAVKRSFRDARGKPVFTAETGRQLHAFIGALPGAGYLAPRHQPFVTSNAADYLPVFVPSVGDAEGQLIYHTRQGGLLKLSFSPKKINRNALILGTTGSGKSYHLSSLLQQLGLAEGEQLTVVDIQGYEKSNYRLMAELFGGAYTPLRDDGSLAFNPFPAYADIVVRVRKVDGTEVSGPDTNKLMYLAGLVCVMAVPGYTSETGNLQTEVARVAILTAYDIARKTHGGPPLISDVVEALREFKVSGDRHEYAAIARAMYLQLETWTKPGPRARLLNRQTTFASSASFQVFDFYGMDTDPQLATVLLMIVSDRIWSSVMKSKGGTVYVVFDETWKMLTHPVAAKLVQELYKTVRKHGGAAWAVTQSVKDIQQTPVAASLLENAELVFVHKVGDSNAVADWCEFDHRQRELVKNLEFRPGEFAEILLFEKSTKKASVLRYRADSFESWVNTTNPADIEKRTKLRASKGWTMEETIRHLADADDRSKAKSRQ